MAQYPSPPIAQRTYEFRTLGLGYANLGTLLMLQGMPYDSQRGAAISGALTAIMTGEAYATSAEMAASSAPSPATDEPRADAARHAQPPARGLHAPAAEYEGLTITPVGIDPRVLPGPLLAAARATWDRAVALGEAHGYRNAQATVLAPTGTIGLVMDCDTTGIEPDFALVKFKKLAGGGYFKIVNQSVPVALRDARLHARRRSRTSCATASAPARSRSAPAHQPRDAPRARASTTPASSGSSAAIGRAFDIALRLQRLDARRGYVRTPLGINEAQLAEPNGDLLRALGFTPDEIEAANDYICGTMTVEGAPHLKPEHLPVFDCANRCGRNGKRFIADGRAHPHDGGGPAVHLRRHLQDHQHAERGHGRGREARLRRRLAPHAQGDRPLPRRLQALPAAQLHDRRRGGAGGGRRRGGGGRAA